MPEFKEKFIAYIDILGFKRLVEDAEAGKGLSLTEIENLLESFGSMKEKDRFEKHGPRCCPESKFIEKNLDFRITQVSDCAVVSAEISPAGAINLISHCYNVVVMLLIQHGIMCRGYINLGKIYHTDTRPIGTGFHKAYESEKDVSFFKRRANERGTPFVEVDPVVCDYIDNCEDRCVKELFSRMTESDGSGTALFPFKRLYHSIVLDSSGERFNPEKDKDANQKLREFIINFRDRILSNIDSSNLDAVKKAEHYVYALNKQLKMCDQTDELIDKLCSPPRGA